MALGEKLRIAMEHLKSAVLLDNDAIREAVKEIQRALISSDVEVNLVFNLSKEIEKRAMKEPPKGMNRREFIIKQTYDLLAELLGGSHELPEQPKRILLLGLFGQGKCVDGKSKVTLADGRIEEIDKIFQKYSEKKVRERDGFKVLLNGELKVPSMNPKTLMIENKEVEALWKLRKRNCLISVSVDHGNNQKIKVTPEHPFFVLKDGVVQQIRADELRKGDFIAMPYSVPQLVKTDVDLIKEIEALELNILDECGLKEKIREKALEEFGTLKSAHKKKKIKAPYCQFSHELKNSKFVRSDYLKKFGIRLPKGEFITVKPVQSNKAIRIPTKLTKEFNALIGYFVGDGHLAIGGLEFFNEDPDVIERITTLTVKLFGITPKVVKDKRRKALKRIRIHSRALRDFFSQVFGFPIGKKSSTVKLNNLLLCQNNNNLSAFMQAYFDCDGNVNRKARSIEATTASKGLAFQLQQVLLRFGIAATYTRKKVRHKNYYRLQIRGISAERFAERIGSIISRKKERLEELKHIGIRQGSGKRDMLPIGSKLRTLRELFGQTIGEVQQTVNSYGAYERKGVISRRALQGMLSSLKSKKNKNWIKVLKAIKEGKNTYGELLRETQYSKGFLNALLFRLQQQGYIQTAVLPNPGKCYVLGNESERVIRANTREKLFEELRKLADSNVFWAEVSGVKKIKPKKWVYDLTVKDNHNFIANGIIVHNTTTAGKLAEWYKKRGRSVGLICADVHRPASFEQLQQLSERVGAGFYGDKQEKNAAKIVQRGLEELKKHDLLILDSAGRSALDEALVREIKEMKLAFNPDEIWLVLSSDIGQLAKKQAHAFHEAVGVNGIIISKTDGSSKGGGALAACAETRAPVYFIGTGEKLSDLEVFDANRYLGRIMGYGDLEALLEKAKELGKESELSPKDVLEGKFNLKVFYKQLEAARKMGPLSKVAEMLGLKMQLPKDQLELGQEKLDSFKVIMDSMTNQELNEPELVNKSRIERIARGSGKKPEDVRELLKQYRQLKKMFEKLKKIAGKKDPSEFGEQDIQKLMKRFSKKKKRFRIK